MFYTSLMDAVNAPTLATPGSDRWFFWFMVGSGVVMTIGVVVEVLYYRWRDRIDASHDETTAGQSREKTAADVSKLSKV